MPSYELFAILLVATLSAHNAWALRTLQKVPAQPVPQPEPVSPQLPQVAPTDDEAYSVYTVGGQWLFDRYPGHPDLPVLENDPAYKVVKN